MHVFIYMCRNVGRLRLMIRDSSRVWKLKPQKIQKSKKKARAKKMEKVKRVGHFVVELSKVRIRKTG